VIGPAERLIHLRDLYAVRNSIVHANGLKEAMSDEEWTRLRKVVSRHDVELSTDRRMLIPAATYLAEAYGYVGASLRGLLRRAHVHADAKHST